MRKKLHKVIKGFVQVLMQMKQLQIVTLDYQYISFNDFKLLSKLSVKFIDTGLLLMTDENWTDFIDLMCNMPSLQKVTISGLIEPECDFFLDPQQLELFVSFIIIIIHHCSASAEIEFTTLFQNTRSVMAVNRSPLDMFVSRLMVSGKVSFRDRR